MDGVEALERVVDRLHEWFGLLPRETVERTLREEVHQYQHRLRTGQFGPSAEHLAFERLTRMLDGHPAEKRLDLAG